MGGGKNCLRRCLRRIRWGDMWQSVDHTMTIYDWLSGAKIRKKTQSYSAENAENCAESYKMHHFNAF